MVDHTQGQREGVAHESIPRPSALSIAGGLLLVAALALSIFSSWNSPESNGRYAVRQADALLREGRFTQSTSLLERTLLTYDSPQLRLELSYAYLARRDIERAQRQASLALASASPSMRASAWAQLGRVLYFAGRQDDALAAWEQSVSAAARYGPDTPAQLAASSARWHTAMLHWRRSDWEGARHTLELLLGGEDVFAASAGVKLAQLLAPTDPARSLRLLDDAGLKIDISDGSRKSIPNLRLPGLSEGLPPEALTGIVETLRQTHKEIAGVQEGEAGEALVQALWGNAYLRMGEPTLAKMYLEEAVRLQPNFADAHARLGLALLDMGDPETARSYLLLAVQLDPRQPLPRQVLARLYTQRGEWELAESEFQAWRDLEPGSVDLHLQLAEYYRLRGLYEEAEDEYLNAVEVQRAVPPEQVTPENDAGLALSRFYSDVRGQGCDKGLPFAKDAISRHPNDPASLDAIGWSLVLCRASRDALPALESVVGIAPDVPRYHYHLAKAYAALGRYTEARDHYTWVMDLDPTGPWERLARSELPRLGE
ncbi:MAG TPA: tetratricopeptide repeat protein [Chloroflexia bacterium]|nr:tetratricopeptide repeat protein [Chloroflexia bacterium]